MKKKKRRLGCGLWILGTTLVIAAVVAVLYVRSKREQPIDVTVTTVERRNLTSIVSATGKVQPVVEVKISSEVAGEIIELPVEEGQDVKRGDLLVRVKPDNYETAVQQREAALTSSRAQSAQSRAQLVRAEQELQRVEELFERQFVSPNEVEVARTQVEIRRAHFQSSLADIEQQEMALQQARENLARTQILAPVDGTISLLNSKIGERVVGTGQFAGTEIMRLADLSNMEVRIDVNENDVVNVAVGQRVRVTIDSFRGRRFNGEVTHIANTARTEGARSQEQVTTFEVRIRLRESRVVLRPGMTAVADIETATVRNAVAVPVQVVTVRDRREVESLLGITRQEETAAAEPAATEDEAERPRTRRRPREGGETREGTSERRSRRDRQPTAESESPAPAAADAPAATETPAADAPATAEAPTAEAAPAEARPRRGDRGRRTGGRRDRTRDRLARVVFVQNGDRVEMRVVETGIASPNHLEITSGLEEGDVVISGPYTAVSRELTHESLIKVVDRIARGGGGGGSGRGARSATRRGPRP